MNSKIVHPLQNLDFMRNGMFLKNAELHSSETQGCPRTGHPEVSKRVRRMNEAPASGGTVGSPVSESGDLSDNRTVVQVAAPRRCRIHSMARAVLLNHGRFPFEDCVAIFGSRAPSLHRAGLRSGLEAGVLLSRFSGAEDDHRAHHVERDRHPLP
jgi:hypothetical protein